MDIPKIFADFNNADRKGRIRLNTNGSLSDIKLLKIELIDGKKVMLDDDDGLATIGSLMFSEEERIWVVEIDRKAL